MFKSFFSKPAHWPGTSGWADTMGVAYAVFGYLMAYSLWPQDGSTAAILLTIFPFIVVPTLAWGAAAYALRCGSRFAYWIALAAFAYAFATFVRSAPAFGHMVLGNIFKVFFPFVFAIITIGCLTSLSSRAWLILRKGELGPDMSKDIKVKQICIFNTNEGQELVSLQSNAESIKITNTYVRTEEPDTAFAFTLHIPRRDQVRLIQALRAFVQAEDLPNKNINVALMEIVTQAFAEKAASSSDIQALGRDHGFAFKFSRQEVTLSQEKIRHAKTAETHLPDNGPSTLH